MPRSDRRLARLAVVGALIAALAVSACGRKGPLDPPPSAYAPPASAAAPGAPAGAPAPPAERKSFPLDFLLN